MAITLSDTFSNNLLGTGTQGVATQIGGGTLIAYASGGSPPAGPNEAASGTVVATWTFNSAAGQGAPTGGSMTLSFGGTGSGQTVTATGGGTVDYFRVRNSSNVALIQGSIGTSGADWIVSNTSFTIGDQFTITGTATIAWVDS